MNPFATTFELTLSRNYVSAWGMVQAVRELIQNALDSESPFIYEFEREESGNYALRLNSQFTTLSPQTLLLGTTTKANVADAIGSFGEGYKLAILVLTRLGYDLEIINGPVLWKPRFRFSRKFNDELLVIDEGGLEYKSQGLTFVVHSLDEQDKESIEASCLLMQDNIGQIKSTQFGDILFDRAGKLYVGGLYVCETEMRYGYNVKPAYMTLERDRQTVSYWDLREVALKMWFETGETELIAQMIFEDVPDVQHARYDCPEIVKEECYRLFREQHPGALVAENPKQLKDMIAAGMTKTIVVGGGMYAAVSSAPSYRAAVPMAARVTPTAILSIWLSRNRSEMRRKAIEDFKVLIADSRSWELK